MRHVVPVVAPLLVATGAVWLFGVTSASAQPRPVTLVGAPVVSENDYPPRAMRAEVGGTVVVDIAVDASGASTGCTPVEVAVAEYGLETATCQIWMRRARFAPARDSAGVAVAGLYRARMRWIVPEPVAPPPPPAPMVAEYVPPRSRVQTVRCETGFGFYIWRVDWDASVITEMVSGIRLTFSDIESTSGSSGYIEADSDPDDVDNTISLDLYFTEETDDEGTLVSTTLTRQNVYHSRGFGQYARSNRYQGSCRPYYG